MLIRPRRDGDIAACAEMVRDVHDSDRYPRFLPEDITPFLAPPGVYGSWVAERTGEAVGHVMLVKRTLPSVLDIASGALGRPVDQIAVVARLFVSPHARGGGAGGMLLDTAAAAAAERGLWPVLDVDKDLTRAIALYESHGWVRAGTVTVRFSEGRSIEEHVYLGPARAAAGSGEEASL